MQSFFEQAYLNVEMKNDLVGSKNAPKKDNTSLLKIEIPSDKPIEKVELQTKGGVFCGIIFYWTGGSSLNFCDKPTAIGSFQIQPF